MPDESLAEELVASATKLISGGPREPSQADLRRAISTAYFAVFHALARACANSLVGSEPESRPNKAWVEVYRGLSHGSCKDACDKSKNIEFPDAISGFANTFVQLQEHRKRVDYDPTCRPKLADAQRWIAIAEESIEQLRGADENSKIAFATWVLITSPGAAKARTAVKENVGPELHPPR